MQDLTNRENLRRRIDALVCHFADVNQAFDTRGDFNKCPEIHEFGDSTSDRCSSFDLAKRVQCRVGHRLLETQGDLHWLGVAINAQHLHLHYLTSLEYFRRVLDSLVGDIANVNQAINAADVRKGTVLLNAGDRGGAGLPNFHLCKDLIAHAGALFKQHGLAAEDHPALFAAQFNDLARELLAQEHRNVLNVADVYLPSRHKCLVVRDFHVQAALIHANAAGFHNHAGGQAIELTLVGRAGAANHPEALKRVKALLEEFVFFPSLGLCLKLSNRANPLALGVKLNEDLAVVHAEHRADPQLPLAIDLRAAVCGGAVINHVLKAHITQCIRNFLHQFSICCNALW